MSEAANSLRETAQRLNVCRTTLHYHIKAGRLPARKLGGRVVVLESDLQQFLTNLPLANSKSQSAA